MKSTYSIVLWKKSHDKGLDDTFKNTFETLSILQKYNPSYRPNYLTCRSKAEAMSAPKFEWNYDNFVGQLRKGVNKEGDKEFPDLGYSISFFSSKESDSAGISAHVGIVNKLFHDSIVINLHNNVDWNDAAAAEEVERLFGELCKEYNPIWGGICDNNLLLRFNGYLSDGKPNFLCWLNYWPDDIEEKVGKKKIKKAVKKYPDMDYSDHILKTGRKPYSVESEDDMRQLIEKQDYILK